MKPHDSAKEKQLSPRKRKLFREIEATIEDLSHDGRGVAKHEGKTWFIDGALVSEVVHAKRIKKSRQFDEGITLDVLQKSDMRVEPDCQHDDICGGCRLQHADPELAFNFLAEKVRNDLTHAVKSTFDWHAPQSGPKWHYRRKARLGVKYVIKKEKVVVGFREKLSHFIADLSDCLILEKPIAQLIEPLSQMLTGFSIKDQIPQIEVSLGDNALALVFRHLAPLAESDIDALHEFAKKYSTQTLPLWIYLQSGGPQTVERLIPKVKDDLSIESRYLYYDQPDFSTRCYFEPLDFVQINRDINDKILNLAIDWLALEPGNTVLDLFCGLGNFSMPLAKRATSVVGVELSEAMVERATMNAAQNALENATFYAHDLTKSFEEMPFSSKIDRLLVDPPRSGAKDVIGAIGDLSPEVIVYVSCNPATLVRDAALLAEAGYKLTDATVFDMFPHTAHVESVAKFIKV